MPASGLGKRTLRHPGAKSRLRRAPDRAPWRQPLVGGRKRRARALPSGSQFPWRQPSAAHLFDLEHSSYAGELGNGPNPKLVARVKSADLVILLGGRLGELPSQRYSILDVPAPRQTLVHVHPGAEELGRVYRAELPIHAAPTAFAAALEKLAPPNAPPWREETKAARADFLAWTEKPTPVPGPVNPGEVIVGLRKLLPADAVVCNGAGNFSLWVHRFYRYRRYGTQLAPIAGSLTS
jgi:acetolactate synthase I/II/III large subunit